jgi:hypothetical protein
MAYLETLPRLPQTSFGTDRPREALMGDTWINTVQIPHAKFKYNGREWIKIDQDITFDDAYIDYLIQQLDQCVYDPELLTTNELDQIEKRLHERKTTGM